MALKSIVIFETIVICTAAVLGKVSLTSATQITRPRGVSLARASLYDPNTDFTCLDGSRTIPFRYVNDEYCDCQDGSDEPGTSACPNGSFYCRNQGHTASLLPSSRVDDGICDCCDGSDEGSSGVVCINNCKQLGAVAQEEAQRRYELESKGYAIKLEYITKGKEAKQLHQDKILALKAEQVEAEALKNEREKEKLVAETPEKEALDRYRQNEQDILRQKEENERAQRESEASKAFDWLDSNQDGKLQIEELQTHPAFDQNQDGSVSEEEAKFFLHMEEEITKDDFITTGWILMKPYVEKIRGLFKQSDEVSDQPGEDQESESLPDDGEEDDEEHEGESQEIVTPSPTVSQEPIYDAETQALIDAANRARDAYNEADRRLREVEREIRQIEETVNKDYGMHEEYQPLEGQCFEYSDREYTYKLCPFDYGSQRPKHGGSETRLGSWGSWEGSEDNRYSLMKYDRGVQCWNGPQRSLKVHLQCGYDNQITSVTEPNRCEYELRFTSPAACQEPKKPESAEPHDEL